MKRTFRYKRIGLVIFMLAAMIATAGCDPASIAFGANQQGEDTDADEQEVETPEANETDEPDVDEGEVEGVVDAVSGNTVTIDGVTYTVPDEFVDELAALPIGATVKIEFFVDANGNLVITEFEVEDEGENEEVDDDDDQGEDNDDQGEDEDEDQDEVDDSDSGSDSSGSDSGDDL